MLDFGAASGLSNAKIRSNAFMLPVYVRIATMPTVGRISGS